MEKDTAIKIENVSKKYYIGKKQNNISLKDSVVNLIKLPYKLITKKISFTHPYIWALKDISFEVKKGEVVGIIGRNGAGKSTLLKILSRITDPTMGLITVKGRVASLLEVGTGFHSELTGRENIYLNATILGMRKKEINSKFRSIVEFSGIEKFLDTPVKRYSSGMYIRLAFSIAANVKADILLVDEVLAVGDIEFQDKCLGKMKNVAKSGRTVLFISHNMNTILKFCNRCILLSEGKIIADDSPEKVVSQYISISKPSIGERVWRDLSNAPRHENIYIKAIRLHDIQNNIVSNLRIDNDFFIKIEYCILKKIRNFALGIRISNEDGIIVLESSDYDNKSQEYNIRERGFFTSTCLIPANLLNEGNYTISIIGYIPGVEILLNSEYVLNFTVIKSKEYFGHGKRPGVIRPLLQWSISNESN